MSCLSEHLSLGSSSSERGLHVVRRSSTSKFTIQQALLSCRLAVREWIVSQGQPPSEHHERHQVNAIRPTPGSTQKHEKDKSELRLWASRFYCFVVQSSVTRTDTVTRSEEGRCSSKRETGDPEAGTVLKVLEETVSGIRKDSEQCLPGGWRAEEEKPSPGVTWKIRWTKTNKTCLAKNRYWL